MIKEVKQILVINLGGIGDLLLSTPALRALKAHFSEAKIVFLGLAHVAGLAEGLSCIDEVLVFHKRLRASLKDLGTLLSLRKRRFDIAINMRSLANSAGARKIRFLLDIIAAKQTLGRNTQGRGKFFDVKVDEPHVGQKYEMEYDIDTVAKLGVKVSDRTIDFSIDEQSRATIEKLLQEKGVMPDDFVIGIHPGGMSSHRWAIGNFAAIINDIASTHPSVFVITGAENERKLVHTLLRITYTQVINTAGRLTVSELAALIKRCNLFITNDTGPMHIAAVLKTPLIAIFGPGHITRFDPRNIFPQAVVFNKGAECAPCEKVECTDMKCLGAIRVPDVLSAVKNFLEKRTDKKLF